MGFNLIDDDGSHYIGKIIFDSEDDWDILEPLTKSKFDKLFTRLKKFGLIKFQKNLQYHHFHMYN